MAYEEAIKEMQFSFMTNLHKSLKAVINAGIHVKITDDVLLITCKNGNDIWEHAIPDILNMLINGTCMESFVNDIVQTYKKHVLSLYFYKTR